MAMVAMDITESGSDKGIEETTQAVNKAAGQAADALDLAIEVLEDVQRIICSGRPKTVKIRFGDRVIAEMPVALTAAMAFAAGLAAVVLTKLAIEVEHET